MRSSVIGKHRFSFLTCSFFFFVFFYYYYFIFSYELEIENLKQQHVYLIEQKGEEQKKFVGDFNLYYEKKTKQVNSYKDELVLLYQHW